MFQSSGFFPLDVSSVCWSYVVNAWDSLWLDRKAVIMAENCCAVKAKVLICPQFERVRSWHRTPWQSFYISYPAEQSRTVSLSLTAGVSSTFNLNVQQYWARTGSLLLPAAPVCASMEVGLTGFTWHPLSVLDSYFFEYSAAVFHAALCSSGEVTRVGLLRAIELHGEFFHYKRRWTGCAA